MCSKLAIGFVAAGIASAAHLPDEIDWSNYSFEQYLHDWGEDAFSELDRTDRAAIFQSNLAKINAHNADISKNWFATVNDFTAWTHEEFRARRVHGKRRRHDDLRLSPKLEINGPLPDAIDWRDHKGVVTPVKNQGGCGSCWAFSATATLESAFAIATGKDAPVLSPQQLVDCAPNPQKCGGSGGCDGSTQELGFQYTETAGLTTEASYPYTARTGTCDKSKIKPVVKNGGFVALPINDYTQLVAAVATKGPIAISVAAGSDSWSTYGGGIYTKADCGFDQDHAVQLVGYGADGSLDYWLVRNSWGPSWGEKGYIRIQRFGEGKEPCAMDNTPQDGSACAGDNTPVKYCGLCAILSDSSYATDVTAAGDEVVV